MILIKGLYIGKSFKIYKKNLTFIIKTGLSVVI